MGNQSPPQWRPAPLYKVVMVDILFGVVVVVVIVVVVVTIVWHHVHISQPSTTGLPLK